MDYMKDGSLHDYLTKEFKTLKWKNKIGILLNIINGLKEIHYLLNKDILFLISSKTMLNFIKIVE